MRRSRNTATVPGTPTIERASACRPPRTGHRFDTQMKHPAIVTGHARAVFVDQAGPVVILPDESGP